MDQFKCRLSGGNNIQHTISKRRDFVGEIVSDDQNKSFIVVVAEMPSAVPEAPAGGFAKKSVETAAVEKIERAPWGIVPRKAPKVRSSS